MVCISQGTEAISDKVVKATFTFPKNGTTPQPINHQPHVENIQKVYLDDAVDIGICSLCDLDIEEVTTRETIVMGSDDGSEIPINSEDSSFSNHTLDSYDDTLCDIDGNIDEAIVDDIKLEDRISSAVEDYDDGDLVFTEADLTL